MAAAKRAVVIGIDNYMAPKIEKLSGAVLDATEIYQVLTENGDFEVKHFLTEGDATSENIRKAISELFWQSEEKCETALFYFAGHGKHDHLGSGYLLPYDAEIAAPFVKGICIQELKRLFIDSKVNTSAIMILDCCYSGIATAARGPEEVDASKEYRDVLRLENTGSGRFILASSGANEKARERKQKHLRGGQEEHIHGLYSFHLIEALRGAAADKEHGQVSLGGIVRHIDDVFRENYPDAIPPISAAGIDMNGIWLTGITERVTAYLKDRLGKIDGWTCNRTLRDSLTAIDEIIELQNRGSGDRDRLTDYFKRMDEIMNDVAQEFQDWWFANGSPLKRGSDVDNEKLDLLDEFLNNLTVENYLRHKNPGTRGFLSNCVAAIEKGQDYHSLIKYMRIQKPAPKNFRDDPAVGEAARTRT